MEHRIPQKNQLKLENLKSQLNLIDQTHLAKKSDRQLQSYDRLSNEYKYRYKMMSEEEKCKRYTVDGRKTKLTWEHVNEIRSKYQPYVYGKARLAQEYGVSVSVIYRVLRRKSWKIKHL